MILRCTNGTDLPPNLGVGFIWGLGDWAADCGLSWGRPVAVDPRRDHPITADSDGVTAGQINGSLISDGRDWPSFSEFGALWRRLFCECLRECVKRLGSKASVCHREKNVVRFVV